MALDTPILFVATTDPKRSRAFYEKTLGFPLLADDAFALVFQVGKLMLRVQKVREKPEIGYTVLGWNVPDITQEVRRLTAIGVRFVRYDGMGQDVLAIWTSPAGAKVAWFSDPDGNTLSLTQFRMD